MHHILSPNKSSKTVVQARSEISATATEDCFGKYVLCGCRRKHPNASILRSLSALAVAVETLPSLHAQLPL